MPIRHCAAAMPADDSAGNQGDTLLLIGGGALCFSFGSTFSPPCTLHLPRSSRAASPCQEAFRSGCTETPTAKSSTPGAAEQDQTAVASPKLVSCFASASSAISSSGIKNAGTRVLGGQQYSDAAECQSSKSGAERRATPVEHCKSSPSTQGPPDLVHNIKTEESHGQRSTVAPSSNGSSTCKDERSPNGSCKGSWALVVPKQEAKVFKDALKHARGLDRRFHSLICRGGASVALPMTEACMRAVLCQPSTLDMWKSKNRGWKTEAHALLRCGDEGNGGSDVGSIQEQKRGLQHLAIAVAASIATFSCMNLAEARMGRSPKEALVEATRNLLTAAGTFDRQQQFYSLACYLACMSVSDIKTHCGPTCCL